ncbi:MAG: hypothetical protein BBJ57_07815 [Desulfobacterales bacterium PC51MH44]|nr:MAG: hypothetical protein BBJ57_07815 [Desulfobacterales bacterium PC51MH44]
MKRYISVIIIVFLLLFSQFAGAAERKKHELAEKLIIKSGLAEQIKNFPKLFETGFIQSYQQSGQSLPEEKFQKIRKVVAGSFDPQIIREFCFRQINTQLSLDDIQATLNWLDSPLGKKITRLEKAASTVEAYKEMQAMSHKLQNSQKSPGRLNLFQRLDKATYATEWTVDMALNTQIATSTAMLASFPLANQPSAEEIGKKIEMNRPQIERMISQQVFISFIYTYRDLSDKEIAKYVLFAESDNGRRYHEVILKALNYAMIDSSKKSGAAIGRVISGDSWKVINEDISRPIKINIGEIYPQKK